MKRSTMALGGIAAAVALAAPAAASASTFTGGCQGGGLNSTATSFVLSCTGQADGDAAGTGYIGSLPIAAGVSVPTGTAKQPYIGTSLDVLRAGSTTLRLQRAVAPFTEYTINVNVTKVLNLVLFTGATGGYGTGTTTTDALGDTAANFTFQGISG